MGKKFFDISPVNTPEGLRIKITDMFGKGVGLNQDENSALVRPYRRFLEDKTKIGLVKYVCFKENKQYFVLGSFVYTSNKRILFFPGTRAKKIIRPPGKLIKGKTKAMTSNEFIEPTIDHITLDPDFRKWHVKLLDRKNWYHSQQTREINGSLHMWCQLQVNSLNELEPLPEKQEIYLKIPNNLIELATILPSLRDSRENSIAVTYLDEKIKEPFFWAFQIFVSTTKKKNFPDLLPTRIHKPPYVCVDSSGHGHTVTKTQITLPGFDGAIWLRAYKIKGRMIQGSFLMSGGGIPRKAIIPQ